MDALVVGTDDLVLPRNLLEAGCQTLLESSN